MIPNVPLFFAPLFRSYLWGGRGLAEKLQKPIPAEGRWAESWEIVDHGADQSVVMDGPWQGWSLHRLLESFPQEILGGIAKGKLPGDRFPLLLKYLDCQRVLSVQVHPDDDYALRMNPPDLGKTEAWYILEADEGASIYAGLKPGTDRQALSQAIEAGQTEACLCQLFPQAGDCLFIPAGTVHALGAGLLVAEIQQASDTTFRLFDWNRVGDDGKPRPLHIEAALDVIDFDKGPATLVPPFQANPTSPRLLVDCDQFQWREWRGPVAFTGGQAYRIVTLVNGQGTVRWNSGQRPLKRGETFLVPAACEGCEVAMDTKAILLEATSSPLPSRI